MKKLLETRTGNVKVERPRKVRARHCGNPPQARTATLRHCGNPPIG